MKQQKNLILSILVFFLFTATVLGIKLIQKPKSVKEGLASLTGDCNANGTVDILDFQLLSNSFGKLPGQTGYDGRCDFNSSNTVDILDFQVLSNNFGTSALTNTPITTGAPTLTSGPTPTFNPVTVLRAFPDAEGFGAKSVGGRGGKVIEVTNLNDSGPGSLRECVIALGPRVCVFRVGGTINVATTIRASNPYLTIAGQTAPGGGITLRATSTTTADPILSLPAHDVIVRYITVRYGPWREGDAVNAGPGNGVTTSYNLVMDHMSMSWGTDQIFATWYGPYNMSFSWNIFSEGLNCATHSKGCHSKGPMLASCCINETHTSPGARNISFHHNLTTNSDERTPLVKTAGATEIVNNLTYNSRAAMSHVDMENQMVPIPVNFIGNYFKAGSNTNAGVYGVKASNISTLGAKIYVKGNISPRRTSDTQAEIDFVDPNARTYVISNPITVESFARISATTAATAYTDVLARSGNYQGLNADGTWHFRRDAIDKRVVNEVKEGKGKVIDAPWSNSCVGLCRGTGYYLTASDYNYPDISLSELNQADGYAIISSGTPYPDSDHDGMSDTWENQYFGNLIRGSSTNSSSDYDSDGYTDLEEFIDGTSPVTKNN